jgi:2-dehydropantoate 2-reductase
VAAQRYASVYGVMVWTPAVHLEPGVVTSFAERDALLRIGCWPEGVDERAHAIAATLSRAGLDAEAVPDVARWKYGKLLGNLANVLDAFLARGGRRELYRELVDEGIAALNAAGTSFMPPDVLNRDASRALPDVPVAGRERPGGSTWQSLARGQRSSEVAYLNGHIVELGAAHGIPTPLNRALVELSVEFESGQRAPRSLTAEELRLCEGRAR